MENTSSKTGQLGAVVLKIGIPLAFSAAGGICAIMMEKLMENRQFSSHNCSSCSIALEDEEISETEEQKPNVEKKEIQSLKGRVEEIEEKEGEIERQFIMYQNLKEREALLEELKNSWDLDMGHISFLEREVLLMAEEIKRFEGLVSEYLGVAEQVEGQRTENRLLVREVKKIKKRLKEQSKMVRENNLEIEMETKKRMLEKLGNEVRELNMQMAELKIKEDKAVTSENFEKLSNEVNQLKDAIEMLRKQEQQEQQEQQAQGPKENPNHKALDQKESSSDKTNSTRTKLLHRIICIGGK